MNTANLDLNNEQAFQLQSQQPLQAHQPTPRRPRTRKKVKVSLRKKDTSIREKRIGIALIVLILGLFLGAIGFTIYHMAQGNAPETSSEIGYLQP